MNTCKKSFLITLGYFFIAINYFFEKEITPTYIEVISWLFFGAVFFILTSLILRFVEKVIGVPQ